MNIETFLAQRFPGEGPCQIVRDHLITVCNAFMKSGSADRKFAKELCSGDEAKFWACISEALLATHLRESGFNLEPARSIGPDLLMVHNGRRVWVEVICPQPTGVLPACLKFEPNKATTPPHEQILLRWTSAIKEKAEKLIGSANGSIKGYLEKGVVGPDIAYVIAVNGCQLRHGGVFSSLVGISQLPVAVEAVFAVGPYQIMINRDTLEQTDSGHTYRPEIPKSASVTVPTCTFLDPQFQPISAIWAVDVNGQSVIGNLEPMAVVHNPNALNPIPVSFLPAHEEYVATLHGTGSFEINKLEGRLITDNVR
jgi:type I restriction enzyme S subunit